MIGRRKRAKGYEVNPWLVRIHFRDAEPSVEGVWLGGLAAHYRLASAKLVESEDASRALDGETLVPMENVLYLQVIG